MSINKSLIVTSTDFKDGGKMLKKNTGFGEDVSPEFKLENLDCNAVSIAIIMDDLDVPFSKEFNHWIIWNIPKSENIMGSIPYGEKVSELDGAVQGIAYGKNRYRGPKQPIFVRNTHRYEFKFYVLDCFLKLPSTSDKNKVLEGMKDHVLQQGKITGTYKR